MKELQQTNSLNQSYVMEQKIRKLEKSLAEMKAKLGIEVIEEEPETPKSPSTPPITKKSVELQLPSKEPKSPKAAGVQFKHMVKINTNKNHHDNKFLSFLYSLNIIGSCRVSSRVLKKFTFNLFFFFFLNIAFQQLNLLLQTLYML
jgi:ribosomal protein L11